MKLRLLLFFLLLASGTLSAQTWFDVPTNVTFDITDLHDVGGGHVFAIGISNGAVTNQVIHSADNGSTWAPIPLGSFANQQLRGIDFTTPYSGYVNVLDWTGSAYKNKLYRTNDRGANWTEVTPSSGNSWSGTSNIIFTDSTTGFFVFEDSIFKTTDAGNSWTNTHALKTYFSSEDVDAFDADHIAFGLWDGTFAYKGAVIATSNGGQSWDTTYFPGNYSQIQKICTGSDSTIFAVTGGGFTSSLPMYKSNDFGKTWDTITINFIGDSSLGLTDIYFVSALRGYICTSPGQIWESIDGGYTWAQIYVDSLQRTFRSLEFNQGFGLAGGDFGALAKGYLPLGRPTHTMWEPIRAYPNPAVDLLNVEVEHPGNSSLRLMDLQGKILLPEKNFSKKTHLDLSALPPGAYLLEVKSNGIREVRKILHR